MRLIFTSLLVTLGFIGPGYAAENSNPFRDEIITSSAAFINEHPDLKYRSRGLVAYHKANFGEAFINFKRAAKFADKPSQGMLAEMLWKGVGVTADKVQAYAWIDVAAERAYPAMISSRENMWSLLSESERKQALVASMELSQYYGDKVAKKRFASAVKRTRGNVVGSHVGNAGNAFICLDVLSAYFENGVVPTACIQKVDSSRYYQDKFWKPEQYFAWQDTAWKSSRTGRVEVLPFEVIPNTTESAADKK